MSDDKEDFNKLQSGPGSHTTPPSNQGLSEKEKDGERRENQPGQTPKKGVQGEQQQDQEQRKTGNS